MDNTPENVESLLECWREVLRQKEQLKIDSANENKKLSVKQREVVRLETQINDKKNLIRILSQKMRDLRKIQVSDKLNQERKKQQQQKLADEEWDSQFRSTRQSDFGAGKVEYDQEIESALEKLLGKEGLQGARKDGGGVTLRKNQNEDEPEGEGNEEQEAGEGEQADGEQPEGQEEQPQPEEPQEGAEEQPAEGNEEQPQEGEEPDQVKPEEEPAKKEPIKLPLTKQLKPWEKPEPEVRTEILVGVRYNKEFENLFDDKTTLRDRKPERIVRILAHYNKEFIVGMQFTYMTANEEIIPGKLHGDKKFTMNGLKKAQYEIQYREKIVSMTAHFSKGIHWLELKTNEGRLLTFGKKEKNPKAVTQTKEVDASKGEEICYVSGGYTGKDNRFTYLAFHLANSWNKQENYFDDMEQGGYDGNADQQPDQADQEDQGQNVQDN